MAKGISQSDVTEFFQTAGYQVSMLSFKSGGGNGKGTKITFELESGERGTLHVRTLPDAPSSAKWLIRNAVTQARRCGRH
jgi:hypothetical protein